MKFPSPHSIWAAGLLAALAIPVCSLAEEPQQERGQGILNATPSLTSARLALRSARRPA